MKNIYFSALFKKIASFGIFSPFSVPSENKICWWVSCHSQIGCLATLPGRLYCSGGFHVFQHFPRYEIETSMNTDIITLIVKDWNDYVGSKGTLFQTFWSQLSIVSADSYIPNYEIHGPYTRKYPFPQYIFCIILDIRIQTHMPVSHKLLLQLYSPSLR